jgi:hypothetical protein
MSQPNFQRLARLGQLPEDKQNQYEFLEAQVDALQKENASLKKLLEDKPRFCEFCDSKGHFHKKDCPTRKV